MSKSGPSILAVIALASLFAAGCRPKTTAHSQPVSDGTIVLLREGSTYGAFFMTNQTSRPEMMDYHWFLRSDGKTTFAPKDPAVTNGVVTNARFVAFGPFRIEWSTAGDGGGWVYYPGEYLPAGDQRGVLKPGGASMAVTFEKDIAKVDASNREWNFKRRP
jgi:hypothetical protein